MFGFGVLDPASRFLTTPLPIIIRANMRLETGVLIWGGLNEEAAAGEGAGGCWGVVPRTRGGAAAMQEQE
jgi:hypothetical protein